MAGTTAPLSLVLSPFSDTGLLLDNTTRRNVVDIAFVGLNVLGGPITLFEDRDGDGVIDAGEILARVPNSLLASARVTLPEGSHTLRAVQITPALIGPPVVTTSLPLTVRIDNTAPTIVSVTQLDFPDPLGLLNLTGAIRYDVRFSEPVTGLDANLFKATGTLPGIHLVTLLPVLGEPNRYLVSVGLGLDGISPDQRAGTLGLALNPSNFSGVVDYAGNSLRGADFALLAPVNIGPARTTVTADINADGLGDAAFLVNDTVVVARGTGTGAFGPTQAYAVAPNQTSLAIADVTGDGRADIVTAGGGQVQVLAQDANGGFALTPRAATGAAGAVLADIDGDGDIDIVVKTTTNSATVLTNDGAGTFSTGGAISLGVVPDGFVSGDFNGDGRVDLAAVATGGTSVAVFTQGSTAGTFTRSALAVAPGTGALAAGDLNGDGRAEIVSGGANGTLEIRGTAAGGGATFLTVQAGTAPTDIRIGDVNADGRQDILYAGADGRVRVAYGDGTGTLATPAVLTTQQDVTALALLDVNGDGRQDLALASGATGTLQVGTGIPVGGLVGSLYTIAAPVPVPVRAVTAVAVAGDDIVNVAEQAGGTVTVTGTLSGPLAVNETLAVRIGGTTIPLANASVVTANGQTTFSAAIAAPAASGSVAFLVQRADGAASTPLAQAFSVDLVAPALTSVISLDGPVTKDASVDFTVTFSESVTGLTAANFGLTGTAAAGLVPVITPIAGGRSYAVTVAASGTEGTLGLTFVPSGLADAAGNPVPGGTLPITIGPVLTLDHLPPVLTLSPIGNDGVLSAAEFAADATVSGSVLGLPDGASVAVSFTDAAGLPILSQTATVTGGQFALPLVAGRLPDGAYVVSVSAVDAAGNVAAPVIANLVVDTQMDGGDRFAIGLDDGNAVGLAGAAAVPLTVTGLDAGATASITFTDGATTVAATVGVNGTLPVDLSGLDGPVTSTVRITDMAGNAATVTGPSITVDTLAPVGAATPSLTQNPGTVSFDVAFGEAITGVEATDFRVAVTGSALGEVLRAVPNGNSYTVTVGNLSGEGTVGLALSATSDIADAAGNMAALASPVPVAIDRVPPPVPAITGLLDDRSDLGGFSTRDATPTLAGTAEANAVVTVSYEAGGATQTLTARADAVGAWSVTAPVLPTGVHAFTATATDASGNVSLASAPRIVTVDTTPGIPFTLAVDFGDGLVNAREAAAVGYVLTGLPTGDTLAVSFTDGSGLPVTLVLDPAGGVIDLSGLDGRVTSQLTYVPFGGVAQPLVGPGATFDVTAPATPEILGFALPGRTPSLLTNDPTPLLVGNGEPGSVVTVVVGTETLSAQVGPDGTWRIPVSNPIAEGSQSISAVATDLAGNVSQESAPLRVTVDTTLDALDPITVNLGVPAGRPLNAFEAAHLTAVVSGIDADATAFITLTGPNGSVAVPLINGQVTVPDLSGLGGSVVASVLVTDAAGNAATLPLPNLAIDAIAPAATIVADPAALPGAASVTFLVTFPEAVTGLDAADFQVVHTGTAAGTISGAVATPDGYAVTVSGITGSGSVSLVLATDPSVNDLVGNVATLGSAVSHLVNVPAVVAPADLPVIVAITEDTGAPGDFVTRDADPVVRGTAQANGTVTLSYAAAGGAIETLVTKADLDGHWSVPLPTLGDGTYALSATLTDAAGNVLGVSPGLSLTIDRTVDAGTPVALAVDPTANAAVDATEAMAVSYAVTGLDAGSTAVVRFTDGDLVRQATVAADGTFMIDLTGLDGNVTSSVTVTDLAGNFGTVAGNTIRVDTDVTAVPSLGGLAVASDTGIKGDGITSAVTPVLTGSAEAGASVSVVLTGPSGPVTLVTAADASGTWTVTAPALADATYAVTATANGASGLPSAGSQPFSLVIDTTADQAPLVALQLASADTRLSATEAAHVSFSLSGLDADSSGTVTFSDGTGSVTANVAANGGYTADLSALTGPLTASALITDAAGNVANPALALPPGLTVDTVAPQGSAVADVAGGTAVASFTYAVTFPEAVANVTADDFALTGTTGASGQITSVTGSGGSYVVTVAGVQGSGTLSLGLAPGSDIADLAGNLATLTPATRAVTGVAPEQPVITAYTIDTGVPGDGVTADATPTLSGIGLAGATVTVAYTTALGAQTKTGLVDPNGTWSVEIPALADGPYSFTASLTANGNPIGTSPLLVLTIDTTADVGADATLTVDPAGDHRINATEAGAVAYTIAGLDPGAVGRVTFTDATHGMTSMDVGNGTYNADLSGFSGPVTSVLTIQDAAANTTTRDGTPVTVDTVAPTGTATPSPQGGSGATTFTYAVAFSEPVANVTADDFVLTGTGGASGRVGSIVSDGAGYLVTVTDVAGTGSLSLGLAATADIADASGNRATLSATPRAVTVGGTPQPAPTLITGFGDDTGLRGDGITSDPTPTLSGTAAAGGTVTVAYVEAGVPKMVSARVDAAGAWSAAIPALANGSHSFTASAVTAEGIPSGTFGPLTFTIDTVADAVPGVSLTVDGPAGGVLTPAQAAAVSFVVAGLDAGSAAAVTFTDGTRTVRVEAGADGTYQADLSGLTGPVASAFVVSDAAGNIADGTGNGVIIGQPGTSPGGPPPTGEVLPSGATGPGQGTSPVGTSVALAVEPTGDGVVNAVEAIDTAYRVTGLDAGSEAAVTFTDGVDTVTTQVTADGRHTVDLTGLNGPVTSMILATDAAGTPPRAAGNTVILDTVGPTAPVVTGFSEDTGLPGNATTADATPTLVGTAEAGSIVAVAYDTQQGPRTATAVTGSDGHWSLDLPPLAEGRYAFVASATDAAGNRGQASAAFGLTIDPHDVGTVGGGSATDGGGTGANLAPNAVADTIATVTHAAAVTGNVLANDSDPNAGDVLHVTAVRFASGITVAVPTEGTATVLGDHGTLHLAADGSYSYQAIGSSNLSSSAHVAELFTYTVSDGKGLSAQAGLAVSLAGAAPAAEATFGFAFTEARVERLGETLVLTGPDGVQHDIGGIGNLHFADGSIQQTDGHALVDDVWYLAHNLDVWKAGVDADTHYETYGWHEGRDPNAYFSTQTYLASNPDVAAAGVNPLVQYAQYGEHEGRSPSPNFSGEAYLAQYSDVAASGENALEHYLHYGQGEGRNVPDGKGSQGHIGAFDPSFYLAQNPDVAAVAAESGPFTLSGPDYAFHHYVIYGADEGRAPNALFDPGFYLSANPDVAASGLNPLLHYEEYGWREGRDPGPNFDTNAYLDHNPDVAAADIDPLQHFLDFGMKEGRLPV